MIDVFYERRMRRPCTYPSVHCAKVRRKDVIGFDMNVNYVPPHSRTTYANDVKFSNFDAGTTAILNIGYAT